MDNFEQFLVRRRGGSDENKEPTGNPPLCHKAFIKTLSCGNVVETDKCLKVFDNFPNEITAEQVCVQNADLLTVAAAGKIAIIQLF